MYQRRAYSVWGILDFLDVIERRSVSLPIVLAMRTLVGKVFLGSADHAQTILFAMFLLFGEEISLGPPDLREVRLVVMRRALMT